MAAFQCRSIGSDEDASHIFLTFMATEMCLTLAKHLTLQCLGNNGQMGDITDATCQHLTLVVATLSLAFHGQRNGHQQVDTIEIVGQRHVRCHQSSQILADIRTVAIL